MNYRLSSSARTAVLLGALLVPLPVHAQDLPAAPTPDATQVDSNAPVTDGTQGTLNAEVLIVEELVPRRVPFTAFRIVSLERPQDQQDVRTEENGHVELQLAPGKYRFQNVAPLKFKGKVYEWSREFEIKAGESTKLQLTGDDALTRDDVPQTSRVVADEAKIYRALRDGVATVESESGHGTGFLVDSRGILLTNHHVVEGSRHLVVRFHQGLRVAASVVETDAQHDVAVIRVNPEVCAGLPVIPMARPKSEKPGETAPAIAVEGEKVLAIGSPLQEEKILTTGLVSRVKDGVLISDVNINPGNSGGPLINMAGEAIGLTTFNEGAASGPGLSGVVTLDRTFYILDKAIAAVDRMYKAGNGKIAFPSATLLPDFSEIAVPSDALNAAAQTDIQIPTLKAPAAFETRFLTPFNLVSLDFQKERELEKKQAKRRSKQSDAGSGDVAPETKSRFWQTTNAVVQIAVSPKLVESKGSKKRGFLGSMLGAMTGTFIFTKRDMEFRHDFYDMQLLRDDVPVEPLSRRRIPLSVYYQNLWINFEAKDTATAGLFSYDPSAFAPGAKLTLRVWREYNTEKPDDIPISDALQASLYEQFAPHRSAVIAAAEKSTAQTLLVSAPTAQSSAVPLSSAGK